MKYTEEQFNQLVELATIPRVCNNRDWDCLKCVMHLQCPDTHEEVLEKAKAKLEELLP